MKRIVLLVFLVFYTVFVFGKLTLKEIRTASDQVLVVVFKGEKAVSSDYNTWINSKIDVNEVKTSDISAWKLNSTQVFAIHKFVTESSGTTSGPKGSVHYIYLEVAHLINGAEYTLETPHGDTTFVFNDRTIFCESVKTNQNGYSSLSSVRYANFAIWLGTGGSKQISGTLPEYEVFEISSGTTVSRGILLENGQDESSGDFVYRIDLSDVHEGGPYRISVKGYGCSWPFGVGGDFSRRLGYVSFRSLFHQRCGIPLKQPYAEHDIRMKACHTTVYEVNAAPGEANVDVTGSEPSFTAYGGYHDAGDADRRVYHLVVPPILMTTYEAFPEYFTDNQFNIPDKFDENYNITGQGNGIPDIIDEAEWATLIWEFLQEENGGVHWGTETKGYPAINIPMDKDTKKYGTMRVDNFATAMAAGVFMHLARILKPYKPERSEELRQRAEKAMAYVGNNINPPQKLYFAVQKYLLTGDEAAHNQIKALAYVVINNYLSSTPDNPGGLGYPNFVLASYFYSYIIEKQRPTDPSIVRRMKDIIRNTADKQIDIFNSFAYPIGNPLSNIGAPANGWACNVAQGRYAYPCLLVWGLTKEQKYIDVVSQLMDYNQGLNPIGKCYVTGIGFNRVEHPHDIESTYTQGKGWGPKPGIQIYGPGNLPDRIEFTTLPEISTFPRERKWVDHLYSYQMNEFTVHETLFYPAAIYPILAQGGTWDETKDPFDVTVSSTGLELKEDKGNNIEVYPNPARNEVTISNMSDDKIFQIELLDSVGTCVTQLANVDSETINFDINNNPKGIYFLMIKSKSGSVCKKLIIQ